MSYRYRYFIQLRVRRRWENALMLILLYLLLHVIIVMWRASSGVV